MPAGATRRPADEAADRIDETACPFCSAPGAVLANERALAIWDTHPVTPGHLLVTTRRHVADFFALSTDERRDLLDLLWCAQGLLNDLHRPDGFNVGVNVGEAAGQTIAHVHVHLIPRYRGDTPRPRGGVRGVIPDKQGY